MDPITAGWLTIGGLLTSLGAAMGARVWNMGRWRAYFARHPGFRVDGWTEPRVYWTPRVGTRLQAIRAPERTRSTAVAWEVRRWPSPLGERFSFSVSRKGWGWLVLNLVGLRNVEVGVPAFDGEFVLASTDAARLRGLMQQPEVRDALVAFFTSGGTHADIHAQHVRTGWRGARPTPESAHNALLATEAVCAAIAAHADAAPVPPPPLAMLPSGHGSQGGGGGLPVAISLDPPPTSRR